MYPISSFTNLNVVVRKEKNLSFLVSSKEIDSNGSYGRRRKTRYYFLGETIDTSRSISGEVVSGDEGDRITWFMRAEI